MNTLLTGRLWRLGHPPLLVLGAVLLIPVPECRAGTLQCVDDEAGRLTAVTYDSSAQLTVHYDHNGSLRHATVSGTLAAEMAVAQSVAPRSAVAGIPFQVLITGSSLSTVGASGVRLVAELPAGMAFLSAVSTAGGCSIHDTRLTCEVGDLPPGRGVTVRATVRATSPGDYLLTSVIAADGNPNRSSTSTADTLTVVAPPSPALQAPAVGAEGPILELAWPALVSELRLEETADLKPPIHWIPSVAPGLMGNTFRLPVATDEGSRYFRLHWEEGE